MKFSLKALSLILSLAVMLGIFSSCASSGGKDNLATTYAETVSSAPIVTKAAATTGPAETSSESSESSETTAAQPTGEKPASDKKKSSVFRYADVPGYSGKAYVAVNGNEPYFSAKQKKTVKEFEKYTDTDMLDRCGVAFACISPETMPQDDRGEIGQVKPSGWKSVKYDIVDGKYLYNRCHLIGYQLAGENANAKNLITGTRYLNISGMLPFENLVADYVKETGNHVLYRVTPVFRGKELVARGVLMEGYSQEDDGDGVCFCVFCYNVQPGIKIFYSTGESVQEESSPAASVPASTAVRQTTERATSSLSEKRKYVVNTKSKKFHLPSCSWANRIDSQNSETRICERQKLIDEGYDACGVCKP